MEKHQKAHLGFANRNHPSDRFDRPSEDEVGEGLIDLAEILKFRKRNHDLARVALGALGYIPREVRDTLHDLRH